MLEARKIMKECVRLLRSNDTTDEKKDAIVEVLIEYIDNSEEYREKMLKLINEER